MLILKVIFKKLKNIILIYFRVKNILKNIIIISNRHRVFNGRLRCCLCQKRPVYSSKFEGLFVLSS